MSLRDKVFSGVLWAGVAQFVSMGCSFAVTLLLARALSPADYGLYFLAVNTVFILVYVGTMGMDRVAIRFASKRIVEGDSLGLAQVVYSCLGLVLGGAAVMGLVFGLLGGAFFTQVIHTPGLAPYIWIVALWLFSAILQGQLTESFRGLNDIRLASLFGGIQSNGMFTAVIVCGLVAAFSLTGRMTLSIAFWIVLSTSVLMASSACVLLVMRLRRAKASASSAVQAKGLTAREAFSEGWPYWLSLVIAVLRLQGGAWLAGRLDTTAHVALFAVAQRLMLLTVGPMIISNAVLPPIVAQLHSSNELKRLERAIRSISGIILLPSLGLLIVLLGGGKIILSLFGNYYQQAYPLLVVLCLGQTFNIATGAWQTVLPMTGNRRHMVMTDLAALFTLSSLGLILGNRYGVMGVAIAFASSVVVTNLLGMLFVWKRVGIWTFASLQPGMLRDAARLAGARLSRRKPA